MTRLSASPDRRPQPPPVAGDPPDTPHTPGAPEEPENLTLTPGPASLTATWTPPAETGGAPLLGHAVEHSPNSAAWHRWPRPDALTTHTTATIEGLTGDQPHQVRVGAVGCTGTSHWTTPAVATPTPAPPTPPEQPRSRRNNGGSR